MKLLMLFRFILEAQAPVRNMLVAGDKSYTVLAVVLIIWLGIVVLLIRLNRRVGELERKVQEGSTK